MEEKKGNLLIHFASLFLDNNFTYLIHCHYSKLSVGIMEQEAFLVLVLLVTKLV
jgi:hypothetical protein